MRIHEGEGKQTVNKPRFALVAQALAILLSVAAIVISFGDVWLVLIAVVPLLAGLALAIFDRVRPSDERHADASLAVAVAALAVVAIQERWVVALVGLLLFAAANLVGRTVQGHTSGGAGSTTV